MSLIVKTSLFGYYAMFVNPPSPWTLRKYGTCENQLGVISTNEMATIKQKLARVVWFKLFDLNDDLNK